MRTRWLRVKILWSQKYPGLRKLWTSSIRRGHSAPAWKLLTWVWNPKSRTLSVMGKESQIPLLSAMASLRNAFLCLPCAIAFLKGFIVIINMNLFQKKAQGWHLRKCLWEIRVIARQQCIWNTQKSTEGSEEEAIKSWKYYIDKEEMITKDEIGDHNY